MLNLMQEGSTEHNLTDNQMLEMLLYCDYSDPLTCFQNQYDPIHQRNEQDLQFPELRVNLSPSTKLIPIHIFSGGSNSDYSNDSSNKAKTSKVQSQLKMKRIYHKHTGTKVQRWTNEESQLYYTFIETYFDLIKDCEHTRNKKHFLLMSQFIGTKTPSQCRSHHQKFFSRWLSKLNQMQQLQNYVQLQYSFKLIKQNEQSIKQKIQFLENLKSPQTFEREKSQIFCPNAVSSIQLMKQNSSTIIGNAQPQKQFQYLQQISLYKLSTVCIDYAPDLLDHIVQSIELINTQN